jgi:hypothetical protein
MSEDCDFEINERTSLTLTVSFFDENDAPVTPDSATYRIDSLQGSRGIAVLPATVIGSLSTTNDLEITSDQNQIIRERNPYEIKLVTVEFDYGTNKHGTVEYRYKVLNLYGVVNVASASVSPSMSASPSV